VIQQSGTYPQRVRAALGRARLVHWDDADVSERLQALLAQLSAPLDLGTAPDAGSPGSESAAPAPAPRRAFVADLSQLITSEPSRPAIPSARLAADDPADPADPEDADDADTLRASGVLAELRTLLLAHPRRGTDQVLAELESIEAGAPEPRERAARVALRTGAAPGLAASDTAAALEILDAVRALTGEGAGRRSPPTDAAASGLARWRALASDPTLPRATREVAATVGRTCERLLATGR